MPGRMVDFGGLQVNAPGQVLHPGVCQAMRPWVGDLGNVRVHTDDWAASSAERVGAAAYTWKNHVVFGAGRYQPDTVAGQSLLAHELIHVAQQRNASEREAVPPMPGREHVLEQNARSVMAGDAAVETAPQAMVQRQNKDDPLPPVSLAMRPKPAAPKLGGALTLALPSADLQTVLSSVRVGASNAGGGGLSLAPGQKPTPEQLGDATRRLVLPVFEDPALRRLAIVAFARENPGGPDRILSPSPDGAPSAAKKDDDKPDVTHTTLVGYDPQNTVVRGAPRVKGSGVGAVVDQAAVQFPGSAKEFELHKGKTPDGRDNPSGDVKVSVLTQPTFQATTEGIPQPAGPNNDFVRSNVQQGSFAVGGTAAALQVGTDKNPRLSVTLGQVTFGPQASTAAPQAGGPGVNAPTQFILGITPLQIEATVHTFGDGSRLGLGVTGGVQVGLTPGQSPVLNLAPMGAFLTYHLL